MKLGDLIDTLAAFEPDMPILFDNGRPVGPLMSWRGVYAELTLTTGDERDSRTTVGEVLKDAQEADGKTFTGYKGGDFGMSRCTPVWADDYGDCDYWGISGVVVKDGAVIVQRINLEDYR